MLCVPIVQKSLEILEQRVPVFIDEARDLVGHLTSVVFDAEISGMLQSLIRWVQL